MSANYKQLLDFTKKIEKLNSDQKEEFFDSCCKELAARLLAKVIKNSGPERFKNSTGTLRRGWTAGQNQNAVAYVDSLSIKKVGNKYHIEITNPVEYASYIEYGHRTKDHMGWVPGHFILTIAEQEINSMSDAILLKKLNKFMKEVFG